MERGQIQKLYVLEYNFYRGVFCIQISISFFINWRNMII